MIRINSLIYAQIILFIIIINIILPVLKILDIKSNSNSINLFEKYYSINRYQSIIINCVINYLILTLANKLPLKIPIIYRRIITILLFNIILNVYIRTTPFQTGNVLFLKQWSLSVGWFAILWDLIYITSTGVIVDKINVKSHNTDLLIISIIGFVIFHL
jgi:hypothetical protein